MKVISLTTDFGSGDFKVGLLSGMILSIAPEAKLADLTHNVKSQDVFDVALILSRHIHYFPPGSIHIFLTGPICGAEFKMMVTQIGNQFFIGPDNGSLTLIIRDAHKNHLPTKYIQITEINTMLDCVDPIFRNLDLVASSAGLLASGTDLDRIGDEIFDLVEIEIPSPIRIKKGWKGNILRVDHFGNLESNIHHNFLSNISTVKVRCGKHTIERFVQTFGNSKPGELVAMIDSSGVVSICEVNGSAAERLKCGVGTTIEVYND